MAKYVLVKFESDEEGDEFRQSVKNGNWDAVAPDEVIYCCDSLTKMQEELVKRG